ncbi:ketohexokinase-like [Condylostylus longicornis]|uniref:ketohexokinase-like n=1 Tax=Condylostylus longicornis TaxID=2530218 RepID=UPI00244E006B|nr:ketohexokinase-like [Condylostylus longicornis]XP_055371361.1 ketohexokinase-like [Condylostylus longicornis]XP_055371362.1 ketohexokinase-like [Condylostylus longicornis]
MLHNEEIKKRIMCVGMCVLDIVHVCEKFPVEDTDKRCLRGHWQRGGNASNNCSVLRQLGAECEFLGMLSNSKGFQFLKEDCHQRLIHIENCPNIDIDPPFSSVILNEENSSRTIIHSNPNYPILKYEHFENIDLSLYKWIHFEGRNPEETTRMIKKIVEYNKIAKPEDHIKISVELEKLKPELLVLTDQADVVFMAKDLAIFFNFFTPKEAVFGLRNMISNKNNIIICTWSSEGSAVLDSTNNYEIIPAFPPDNIIDTLGAGDSFCAAAIYALSNGENCFKSVEFGNRIAGFKLSFYGYDKISEFNKS